MQRHPIMRAVVAGSLAAVVAVLGGCASAVPSTSAVLLPLSRPAPELRMERDLPVALGTGFTRVVPAHSRWRAAGELPQGLVYRPVDIVFALEGRDVHEAWLVVRGTALQGFFLAGESRFSPLHPPLPLPTGESR